MSNCNQRPLRKENNQCTYVVKTGLLLILMLSGRPLHVEACSCCCCCICCCFCYSSCFLASSLCRAAARWLGLEDPLVGLGFIVGRLKGLSFSFCRYAYTVGTNILSMISPNFFESFTLDKELIAGVTKQVRQI